MTAIEAYEGPLAVVASRLTATDDTSGLLTVARCERSVAPPPGALVAVSTGEATVSTRGNVVFAGSGWAQLPEGDGSDGEPMRWPTRTDAGSVTKIVATTAAIMVLVDEGRLDLDAPADRYLPALAGRGISVRHLLEHRAGLWEWWPLYLTGRHEAAVTRAISLPPRYPVDDARHYSDLGFILLGEIVAHVAGGPLEDAVRQLVWKPWGLANTRYRSPAPGGPVAASSLGDAIERRMVETGTPYPVEASTRGFPWRTNVLVGEVNDGNAFHAFDGAAGHAGVFTTAADLLAFADSLRSALAGHGPVRRETALAFVAPGRDPGQGLGFRIWADSGHRAIGHTGFPGVAFALLPEDNASVVMITNRLHAAGVPDQVEAAGTEPMWAMVRTAARDHLTAHRRAASA